MMKTNKTPSCAVKTAWYMGTCMMLMVCNLILISSNPLNAKTCKLCADFDNPIQRDNCEKEKCKKSDSSTDSASNSDKN